MSIISVVNVPNTTAVPIKLCIVTCCWVTNQPTLVVQRNHPFIWSQFWGFTVRVGYSWDGWSLPGAGRSAGDWLIPGVLTHTWQLSGAVS